jgi:mono/diheme cytochrome c family protein
MKRRAIRLVLFLASAWLAMPSTQPAEAQRHGSEGSGSGASSQQLVAEGENKFHANCGRCHQAPHHLAPRVVMTVERHMRVRATLTDEDVKAIVAYLTQ